MPACFTYHSTILTTICNLSQMWNSEQSNNYCIWSGDCQWMKLLFRPYFSKSFDAYACMCVCIYMCVYVCLHTYIRVRMYTYIHSHYTYIQSEINLRNKKKWNVGENRLTDSFIPNRWPKRKVFSTPHAQKAFSPSLFCLS